MPQIDQLAVPKRPPNIAILAADGTVIANRGDTGGPYDGLRLDPPDVETNLIFFDVDPELGTAKEVAAALKERGVLVQLPGPQTIRACTHLDVSASQAERAAETIRQTVPQVATLPG